MRALEAAAVAAGVSEADLQREAGTALAREVARLLPPDGRLAVLVGHGNNGRDGAVAAGWLAARGATTTLVLAPRHALSPAEVGHLRDAGARVVPADDQGDVARALDAADVAIDALAGIGVHGALREPLAGLARALNAVAARGRLTVVSADVPSGVDADTGAAPGDAVRATRTVVFGALKVGLLRFPGAEYAGRVVLRALSLPAEAARALPVDVLAPEGVARLVPARPPGAHKYHFGRVLVVAGSDHFPGAAVLCAGGAARVGAGLVTVASSAAVRQSVAAHLPEVTFAPDDLRIEDDPLTAAASLTDLLASHQVLVLGPGLGRGEARTAFVREVLRLRASRASPDGRLVVDADGLYALSQLPNWPSSLGQAAVLTPHQGELDRLTGPREAERAGEAPWERASGLARAWGCVLVAKGPFTSVADETSVAVWPHANPALATGGTGDVLAGVCGGLLAQGAAPADAARLAVVAHAMAAERVVAGRGWRTLLASDLFATLPAVLADLGGYSAASTSIFQVPWFSSWRPPAS